MVFTIKTKTENKYYVKRCENGFYNGCIVSLKNFYNVKGEFIAKRTNDDSDIYKIINKDGSPLGYNELDYFHKSNIKLIR